MKIRITPAHTHNQAEHVMTTHAEMSEKYPLTSRCDNFRDTRYFSSGSTLYCVQRVVHWLLMLPRDRSFGQERQQGRLRHIILNFSVLTASTISDSFIVHATATDLAHRHELAFGSTGRMSPRQRSEEWNGRCSTALGVTPRGGTGGHVIQV